MEFSTSNHTSTPHHIPLPCIQKGVWTPEEHARFLQGVVQHGKNWRQVRRVVATRKEKQIQSHYQKYQTRLAKMVKKLKRKGPASHHSHDSLTVQELHLYRELFNSQDLTPLTPTHLRTMILNLCQSPRKVPNIILIPQHPRLPQLVLQTPVQDSMAIEAETQWSPKPGCFFLPLTCCWGKKEEIEHSTQQTSHRAPNNLDMLAVAALFRSQ